jgi:trypsin
MRYDTDLISFDSLPTGGSSLIAPDIILTAGHCQGVANTVHLGSLIAGDGVKRYVEKYIPHPAYTISDPQHDFMLLKIHGSALQDTYYNETADQWVTVPTQLATIPLNSDDNNPQEGDQLTVMGFGVTEFGQTQKVNEMHQITVPAYDRDCDDGFSGHPDFDPDTMFCAGYPEGGKDSCQVRNASVLSFGYTHLSSVT